MRVRAQGALVKEWVTFGDVLRDPDHRSLRSKLRSLWSPRQSPLWVDSLLALATRMENGAEPDPPEGCCLLFDLDHLFLLKHRSTTADAACGPHSLVRYVIDGYPRQPFELLEERSREEAFRFLHPLDSLNVLRFLWDRCEPGRVTVLRLADGRIERGELAQHPADPDARRQVARPTGEAVAWGHLAEQESAPGRSLRRRTAPDFNIDLVGVHSPVRELRSKWSALSLPVAAASIAWDHGSAWEWCHGQGLRARCVESIAVFEALERLQVASHPPEDTLTYGSFRQLERKAVDPRSLFFQRSRPEPHSRLSRYGADVPLYWTRAEHWCGDGSALVPAQEIWFGTSELPGEHLFIRPTTNGCAVGSCPDEAALFALFEAIERDAYLTTWYLRRPCRRLELEALDHEHLQMLWGRWRLLFPWLEIHLFDITTDTAIPTVCAIARREEGGPGPRTIHGAAARPTLAAAAFAAVKDLSALVSEEPAAIDAKRRERLLHEPQSIRQPWDHFELYGLDETFERLSFFPWDGEEVPDSGREQALVVPEDRYDAKLLLERIARHLETLGVTTYFRDISLPWLVERGVCCMKAITPGLYPMWFGSGNCRFAITPRLERLARRYLGRSIASPAELNLEIHPFS